MDKDLHFEILGSLRVCIVEDHVAVTGRERILLAMLLLHANEFVSMERLVDAIWGGHPPRNARNQVHTCVSRLRKRLAEAGVSYSLITTDSAGYRIEVLPDCLDLLRFRSLVAGARAAADQGQRQDARDGYRAALASWRGPALAGVDSEVVRATATALEEERVRAAEERIEIDLALGGAGELVAELTELVAQHPYRESLYASLMVALYRAGRQADALAAYQRARSQLVEEVGTEPGAALRDVHRRILEDDQTLLVAGLAQAVEATSASRRYLPRDVDDYTGRPEVVARLLDAANADSATATVLAIDGMAGIGKTTLAVHVAHLLADRYPDAQLFIDLHGHSEHRPMEPTSALDALLRQLGIPGGRIPPELDERASLWRNEMADRSVLVVLDNAASTAQVRHLLPAGASCLVLVTSRRRLIGLDATRPLSLGVLTDEDGVALLAQVAGERVHNEPAAAAEVASRCGNLPLAIRLAGARLAHRSSWRVQDLADRLHDARGLLTELAADDRSVTDAFALSYVRLQPGLQRTFRLLGLHPGEDFDAHAVAALADLDLVESKREMDDLVDWHLVEELCPGRYRLHDLVREYANQLTAVTDREHERYAAIDRMLDFYLHAAFRTTARLERPSRHRSADPGRPKRPDLLVGPTMLETSWLEAERSNLAAAVRLAAEVGADKYAWRIARALWPYIYHRCYFDDLLETHHQALAAAERSDDGNALATTLNYLASAYNKLGKLGEAANLLQRAATLRHESGDEREAAMALRNLAVVYRGLGRLDDALQLCQRALALQQRIGDLDGMGLSLQSLGIIYTTLGRYREATKCHRRDLAIARMVGDLGDLAGWANPLGELGTIRRRLGAHDAARRLLSAALMLKRRYGRRDGEAEAVNELGVLDRELGRYSGAIARHREALAVAQEMGERPMMCAVRNDFGLTLREAGDATGALEQHRIVLAEATRIKLKYEHARALDGIAACLRATDPDAARQHWRRALTLYEEMGVPERAEVKRQLAELSATDQPAVAEAPAFDRHGR